MQETETIDSSNFSVSLLSPISPPAQHSMRVSLVYARVPYTFYNIQAGVNDTLCYGYGVDLLSTDRGHVTDAMVLPEGNYSAQSLALKIVETVNGKYGPSGSVAYHGTLSMVYDRSRMKFEFSVATGDSYFFLAQSYLTHTTPP